MGKTRYAFQLAASLPPGLCSGAATGQQRASTCLQRVEIGRLQFTVLSQSILQQARRLQHGCKQQASTVQGSAVTTGGGRQAGMGVCVSSRPAGSSMAAEGVKAHSSQLFEIWRCTGMLACREQLPCWIAALLAGVPARPSLLPGNRVGTLQEGPETSAHSLFCTASPTQLDITLHQAAPARPSLNRKRVGKLQEGSSRLAISRRTCRRSAVGVGWA